jgi:hypothetical protein
MLVGYNNYSRKNYLPSLTEIHYMVCYEWDVEIVTDKDMDVMDHNHAKPGDLKSLLVLKDTIPDNIDGCHYELVLVRNVWDEFDGVTQRQWAYEEDGKMPTTFDNGQKVPKRFLAEYKKIWK